MTVPMPEHPTTAHGQTYKVSFRVLRSTRTATQDNKARRKLSPQGIIQALNTTDHHKVALRTSIKQISTS